MPESLSLTTFAPLKPVEILKIDHQYEETKKNALAIRNMSDSDAIDAVFHEISDKPVYLENPESIIDIEKLLEWKKISNKVERKNDKKEKKEELKNIKLNSQRGNFFKDVLAHNSKNAIKAMFIGFTRGFVFSWKNRYERMIRKELKRAVIKNYREKEKLRSTETAKLKEEKWKEQIKNSNAPYTPNATIPRFSAKYEGLNHIERLANRAARKEMNKWQKEYQRGERKDRPLVKDFLEVRDLKFKLLYREQEARSISAEKKMNRDRQETSLETQKLNQEIDKITHPTQHISHR